MLQTFLLPINRRITTIALSVLLAACGGGGGDQAGAAVPVAAQGQTANSAGDGFSQSPQQPPSGNDTQAPRADASMARFNNPNGIVLAANGDLYVADSGNHTIRRITQSGVVTTIAGAAGNPGIADGAGAAARFNNPHGIAIDSNSNLYVTDRGNHTVRKITLTGVVTTLAGVPGVPGSANGAGITAQFNLPSGIATDAAGNVYVADTENYLVRRITPTGSVSTLIGTPGSKGIVDGDAATAVFANVLGLTINTAGDLFVTDGFILPPEPNTIYGSMIVRKIDTGGIVSTHAGALYPETSASLVDGPGSSAKFYISYGLVADGSGNLYVADSGNNAIRKIAPDRVVTTLVDVADQISSPRDVTVDAAGNIYFTDFGNHVIRKLTPGGDLTTYAGTVGAPGAADVP